MITASIVMMVIAAIMFCFSAGNLRSFAAENGALKGPVYITAYVDDQTGQVTFDKGTLTNNSVDTVSINQAEVKKMAGIDDGSCT